MATSTMFPAKPTLGSHEWLMNSITGSYSASSRATRWKPSATWTSELRSRSGSACSVAVSTRWPPLIATISSLAIGASATRPRPAISLGRPLAALGEM
jgi:hypothetical protein